MGLKMKRWFHYTTGFLLLLFPSSREGCDDLSCSVAGGYLRQRSDGMDRGMRVSYWAPSSSCF